MKNLYEFANKNNSNIHISDEEFIKNKVNDYSKLSEPELMSKLLNEVASSKHSGNFDFEKISQMANSVKGYLTAEQQSKLENLLNKIR